MKTYTQIAKKYVVLSSVALLMSGSTMWAQDAQNQDLQQRDQSTLINQNEPQMTETERDWEMNRSQAQGEVINEPAGAEADGRNWSWIGLLGLLGLFGLKRRSDVHDEHYRPVRA